MQGNVNTEWRSGGRERGVESDKEPGPKGEEKANGQNRGCCRNTGSLCFLGSSRLDSASRLSSPGRGEGRAAGATRKGGWRRWELRLVHGQASLICSCAKPWVHLHSFMVISTLQMRRSGQKRLCNLSRLNLLISAGAGTRNQTVIRPPHRNNPVFS